MCHPLAPVAFIGKAGFSTFVSLSSSEMDMLSVHVRGSCLVGPRVGSSGHGPPIQCLEAFNACKINSKQCARVQNEFSFCAHEHMHILCQHVLYNDTPSIHRQEAPYGPPIVPWMPVSLLPLRSIFLQNFELILRYPCQWQRQAMHKCAFFIDVIRLCVLLVYLPMVVISQSRHARQTCSQRIRGPRS